MAERCIKRSFLRKRMLVMAAFLQNEMQSSACRLTRATGTYSLMTAVAASGSSLPRAVALLAALESDHHRPPRETRPRPRRWHRRRISKVAAASPPPAEDPPLGGEPKPKSKNKINGIKDQSQTKEEHRKQEPTKPDVAVVDAAAVVQVLPPICNVDEQTFKEHFGMDKERFEPTDDDPEFFLTQRLLREIHTRVHMIEDEKPGHAFFSPSPKKLLLTAWLLCTNEPFRSVADRFKISKGGIHVIFVNMCHLLVNTLSSNVSFVQWPDATVQKSNATLVESETGLPGVIGCLSELRIQEAIKIGSKVSPTVTILQVVCDAGLRFTDIYVSDPAMHPPSTRIIAQTPLLAKLSSGLSSCPGHHVIADSSYPLMTSLLTPYSERDLDGREQIAYNQCHAAAMEIVGRTFNLLRARFRRLNRLHMSRSDLVSVIIRAICCLHNYIVEHDDVQHESLPADQDDLLDKWSSHSFSGTLDDYTPDMDAVIKRDEIAQMLGTNLAVQSLISSPELFVNCKKNCL